jgi:hypothetical protein
MRMGTRGLAAVVVVASLAAAAQDASAARAATGPCSSGQVVKTKSYVMALSIGPVEAMYTPAEVRTKHPKEGEVMVAGTMTTGMAGMTTSTSGMRHLEVHICTSGGAVVTGAHPSIVIDDPSAKTMTMTVPVATMQGVGMGQADVHYGNNVTVGAGHHITVTVRLNGQSAVFHATVPKTSM